MNHNVAYRNLKNCGVTTINKEGKVTLKIKCPQSYFEKGKRFMKHIHLVISNKQRTDWLNKLTTIGVLCKVNRIPSCYHKLHLNKAVLRTLKNSTSAKIMKMLGITRKMKPERCSIALLGLNEESRMKAYIILSKKGFTDIIQKSGMRGGGLFNTITRFLREIQRIVNQIVVEQEIQVEIVTQVIVTQVIAIQLGNKIILV